MMISIKIIDKLNSLMLDAKPNENKLENQLNNVGKSTKINKV